MCGNGASKVSTKKQEPMNLPSVYDKLGNESDNNHNKIKNLNGVDQRMVSKLDKSNFYGSMVGKSMPESPTGKDQFSMRPDFIKKENATIRRNIFITGKDGSLKQYSLGGMLVNDFGCITKGIITGIDHFDDM